MPRLVLELSLALALVAASQPARANPAGDVTGTSGPAGTMRVRLSASYELALDSAAIARERAGVPDSDPLGPLPRPRELAFRQIRQTVTPRVELGIYRDVWLSLAAPIVLGQSRELTLAGGADRATASTFTDRLLPPGGFDARAPATAAAGDLVFRGPDRSGVSELRAGLGLAVMNQARDDTKPTWKLGAELRLAVGRIMRFDAVDPGRQTGVSTGVDALRLWTSVDRRGGAFEGWFEAFYQRPLATRDASLFQDPGYGATGVGPADTAGIGGGGEAYLIGDAGSDQRVSAELGGQITAHFGGRDYSELWEMFAFAGDRRTDGPLVLDADPVSPGVQALSHPGISNLESYLETLARLALRARLGGHLSLAITAGLRWRTDHVISFAGPGVDLPTCPTGAPRCETDEDDRVTPGTAEVNPLHAPRIDLVGHRYHAEAGRGYTLGVEARAAF